MAARLRSPLAVIFLTVFLDLLGFGMVIPILPLYARDLHATDSQIGNLMAIYSVMQLIFAPIWGRLSDRAGRRPVLLISILGSCGSQFGYALAPSFTWLLIARGFAGACGANITAAQAYIADVTDEKSRAAGMGILGTAFGLGFVFGPAVGGILSKTSPNLPFFVSGFLAVLNFVLAVFVLKEPRAAGQRSQARTLTWAGLLRTVSNPRLLSLMLLLFIVTFGFANLEATFSLYLDGRFGYRPEKAGYLFAYIGVLMVLVQGGLVRRMVPRVGERKLILFGTLTMAIGFLLQAYSFHLPLLLVAMGIIAIGNGFNTPSLSSLISRSAGGEHQGGVLGVSQAFGALARIVGPKVGVSLLIFGVGMPYFVGAGILAAAFLFALTAVKQPMAAAPAVVTSEPIA